MKKDDLKTCMQALLRNGKKMHVLLNVVKEPDGILMNVDSHQWLSLNDYNEKLIHFNNTDFDIMAIYSPKAIWKCFSELTEDSKVWERASVKPYELFLDAVGGEMYIRYYDREGNKLTIGGINDIGRCYFMSSRLNKDKYIDWLKNKPELQEESESVIFMGSEYYISDNFILRNSTILSPVFDFELNKTFAVCKDENLMCYPNDTIILY